MKKSGFKIIFIIVILIVIGIIAYVKLVPEKDNLILKLFDVVQNNKQEENLNDTHNGVYVFKKQLDKTYNITNSCHVSSLDTYIVVINKEFYTYTSNCMITHYEGKGSVDELEFNMDNETKKYTLTYNDNKYTKDIYKKNFVITTLDDQATITKVIDLNNLTFILENTELPDNLYNIQESRVASSSSAFKISVLYKESPMTILLYAGKVLKYSYSFYDLQELPKMYTINTDYIAIIEKHGKKNILKIIDSDRTTSNINYNSDDNYPKLVDNTYTLTTDNNTYIRYDSKNKKFDVLVSLDGKYCVEDGTDNQLTFYRYEITYDYRNKSWTKMNYKESGYAQTSCSVVKQIMGEDYGSFN